MWAVIHYLKTWGHYIGSKNVVVWTDNVTLKYFATQPKLSSKQVRWQYTLALFNVDIRHKFGKENVVPNVLSQKHQLKVVYVGETELQKEVRLMNCHDELAKESKQNIQKGIKSRFHLWNGLLWYKQNRLYVPKMMLRDLLLKECHDGPLAGHGGAKRTTTFFKKSYYWLNLKDDAEEYVKTCLTCQQNRTLNRNKEDWDLTLPYITMGYKMSKHASLSHFAFYFLFFGRHPIPPSSIVTRKDQVVDLDSLAIWARVITERASLFKKVMPMAMENLSIAQHQNPLWYAHTWSGSYKPKVKQFDDGDFMYL